MISLPGLALCTGRSDIARQIIKTFARFVSKGLVPNNFPDSQGSEIHYNTADASLWYFQAVWSYYVETGDIQLVHDVYSVLADIVDWHVKGTDFNIRVDPVDKLLAAGAAGTQLTWMDAKVDQWVVTPRQGKPIEINALWYNALRVLCALGSALGENVSNFSTLANAVQQSFGKFWNPARGYCFDVIDGPGGDEDTLRPNQLFAISLPHPALNAPALLSDDQKRAVVDICEARLLTLPGMRSLDPADPNYRATYGGDQMSRDGAYHQGTVWAWLKGPFIESHLRTYGDIRRAEQLLAPMIDAMGGAGIGTLGEIFDGSAPFSPRGCIAQAWSVAELLRVWTLIEDAKAQQIDHITNDNRGAEITRYTGSLRAVEAVGAISQ